MGIAALRVWLTFSGFVAGVVRTSIGHSCETGEQPLRRRSISASASRLACMGMQL
jgi:hypothetical protein